MPNTATSWIRPINQRYPKQLVAIYADAKARMKSAVLVMVSWLDVFRNFD